VIRIVCFPLGVTAVCLDIYLVAQRALQAGWDMSLLGVAVVVALIGVAALTYAPTLKAEGRRGDALAAYLVGVAIAAIVLVANTARIHAVNQANTALAEQQLALKAGALAQQKRAQEAYAQAKKGYENAQRAVEYECTDRQGPQCEKRREERDKVQASFDANGKALTSAEVTHASIKVLSDSADVDWISSTLGFDRKRVALWWPAVWQGALFVGSILMFRMARKSKAAAPVAALPREILQASTVGRVCVDDANTLSITNPVMVDPHGDIAIDRVRDALLEATARALRDFLLRNGVRAKGDRLIGVRLMKHIENRKG
jgi:hypothetical protein